jgi:hypothetical protein
MVHCLFFNFVEPFDFGCCLLAQEMSFVVCYLPCFREWLISHPLLAFLPFQHLFTDSSAEISSLPLPLSSMHFWQSCPFCCVLVFSSLFIVQFFFFFFGGSKYEQGAMVVYIGGGWENTV